jgi:hypothetical protein
MDENNAPAPVQDAPAEPAEQTNPEPAEAPEPQPVQEPSQPTQANEGAEAPEPEQETPPPSDPEFDPMDGYGNVLPQQQYEFQPNEDGTVDPYAVAQQLENRVLEKIRFEQQEAKQWQKIDSKYGDKLNNNVRQMIRDRRIAEVLNGKNGNLGKIADNIMDEITSARSAGRAEATTSTKVQRAASLETTTANSGPSRDNDLLERVATGDRQATTDLLADWLENGKL